MAHHHVGYLDRLEHLLEQLVREFMQLKDRHHHGHTTIQVVEVSLVEDPPMTPPTDHMQDLQLPSSSVHAVLAVVGPQLASSSDANPVYATNPTWSTDNPDQLPLEPVADSILTEDDGVTPKLDAAGNQIPVYKVKALTPLDEGSGTVTWSAAGMASVDIKVKYSDPPVGHAAITPSVEPD